jgi:hypothetical protein
MPWRGYLVLPIIAAIIFFVLGQNVLFRLSDPLDLLSTLLSGVLCLIQIIIWIGRLRRARVA